MANKHKCVNIWNTHKVKNQMETFIHRTVPRVVIGLNLVLDLHSLARPLACSVRGEQRPPQHLYILIYDKRKLASDCPATVMYGAATRWHRAALYSAFAVSHRREATGSFFRFDVLLVQEGWWSNMSTVIWASGLCNYKRPRKRSNLYA